MKTIKIGDQEWMSENLNVSTFRNGEAIAHAQTNEQWQKAGEYGIAAWCYYDNHPENGLIFGKLYNFFAVSDPRGISPEGWHVPTDDEWRNLVDFLGGSSAACADMKSKESWERWEPKKPKGCPSCLGWDDFRRISEVCAECDNIDFELYSQEPVVIDWRGTNRSGFRALPAGARDGEGGFNLVGSIASWWSSSDAGSGSAFHCLLYSDAEKVLSSNSGHRNGLSVRCVRD